MMYQGIDDMPQAVWRKIGKAETDLAAIKLLFIKPKKLIKSDKKKGKIRLQEIQDQYFDEILMDDDLELKILKYVDIEILRGELMLDPNNGHKKTLLRALEMELAASEKPVDNSDKKYYTNKAHLSKYMQFHVDESVVSVREFDSMFRVMIAEYEAMEAERLRKNNIS
jgi:hypothetical protein